MMDIIDASVFHRIYEEGITGKNVVVSQKLFKDIAFIYENAEGVPQDTVMYTVYSHSDGDPAAVGNLNWGMTVLEPVFINGECNMTRGHFHYDKNCAEYYFGIGGEGLLVLMDEAGHTWAEKVTKGSLHHIDGKYAHRLVNTGNEPLAVGACWPTTAGHDYDAIDRMPFGYRIFKENGEVVTKERER